MHASWWFFLPDAPSIRGSRRLPNPMFGMRGARVRHIASRARDPLTARFTTGSDESIHNRSALAGTSGSGAGPR